MDNVYTGLILVIIFIIMIWITYLIDFPKRAKTCTKDQYYTSQQAVNAGYAADTILKVNSGGQLIYTRVPSDKCDPGGAIDVISYPKYCTFRTKSGVTLEGLKVQDGHYMATGGIDVNTLENCAPISGSLNGDDVIRGIPKIKL